MHNPDEDGPDYVSTGLLPPLARTAEAVAAAHARFAGLGEGVVASYIPALAAADPAAFGLAVCAVDGRLAEAGDSNTPFSIQSISKAFVLALVIEAIGPEAARAKLGVNNTGMPFDSVIAVEWGEDAATNPMGNAGALAASSLVPGADFDGRWRFIQEGLSRFAGRPLDLDRTVFESEMETNGRNRGIATLLASYGRLWGAIDAAVTLYTRQCALAVTARDLAVMGATLGNGGTNPLTGDRVVGPVAAKKTLAVLAAAGLYERTGDWLYDVGLPGKSGVSGGILTVAPGKGGMGAWSPPLDPAGNSVRAKAATRFLSDALGLNLFASQPAAG
jgi:glutaminase